MAEEFGSLFELKLVKGEKRVSAQFGETLDRCKRVKMRDLDSVCRSEEMMKGNRRSLPGDKKRSEDPLKDVATSFPEIAQAKTRSKTIPSVVEIGIKSSNLNSETCIPINSVTMDHDATLDNSKGVTWDLNVDNESNSKDPFFHFKKCENPKLGDVSECGSTTGPLEYEDPTEVWKLIMQNGFLSSSHEEIKVPKTRGRKSKNDSLHIKMELAKKKQVDRFAKMAAPSGLLSELNPGIINHVRNRKQVHSIIEALVRLGKNENSQDIGKQVVPTRNSGNDEHISRLEMTGFGVSHEGSFSNSSISHHIGGSLNLSTNLLERDGNPKKVERWFPVKNSCPLRQKHDREDDEFLALKLASSITVASEDTHSLFNEESANLGSVSSLSVKAATVAFQWLEVLQQDIKCRLAALSRSKNRIRSVIATELPFLMSREFSDSQEKDPYVVKSLVDGCFLNENAIAHRAKWSDLFDQMDKSLSEEEKQLEIWSHKVKEMQLQCQKGQCQFHQHSENASRQPGTSETNHRVAELDKSERELAVRAAAASIHSTCNFLSSSENLPCY